ncbi:MAG: polyprenyl synthetase family protein [Comamonadaceae bacterium]|nr:MAG: polyprenyl synthetase family protein [Comamonadaceae bacterium]
MIGSEKCYSDRSFDDTMGWPRTSYGSEIDDVDTLLDQTCRLGDPAIDEPIRGLLAGGKRLRPGLALATARAFGTDSSPELLAGAASVELLHAASLVHDDIVDDSIHRRGAPTIHRTLGHGTAILIGDLLLAWGGGLASASSRRAPEIWHTAFGRLTAAQLAEDQLRAAEPVHSLDDLISYLEGKTAALIQASCLIGAACSTASESDLVAVADFGTHFGLVFQMVDDLLDVIGSADKLGKPIEQDLPRGLFGVAAQSAYADPDGDLSSALERADLHAAYGAIRRPKHIDAAIARILDHARTAVNALAGVDGDTAELRVLPERYIRWSLLSYAHDSTHASALSALNDLRR